MLCEHLGNYSTNFSMVHSRRKCTENIWRIAILLQRVTKNGELYNKSFRYNLGIFFELYEPGILNRE